MINRLYWMLLVAFIFISCNNNIEVSPNFSNTIVVEALFAENNTININLFRNISLSDSLQSSSDYYVKKGIGGATVLLFDNDVLVDSMKQGKYACIYHSKIVALALHEYKIVVSHPDFETVEAKSIIPFYTPVDSVKYFAASDSVNMKLLVQFTDDANIENYYAIRLYSMKNGFRKIRGFYNTDPLFGSELQFDFNLLGFESGIDKVYRAELTDKWYNGNAILFQAILPVKFEKIFETNNINRGDTIGILLYSINKELYEYNQSVKLYQQAQGSGAQPTSLYSNVKNGVGIFTGYSLSNYEFVF